MKLTAASRALAPEARSCRNHRRTLRPSAPAVLTNHPQPLPRGLRVEFHFGYQGWPNDCNGLLVDGAGNLYVADVKYDTYDATEQDRFHVMCENRAMWVSLEEATMDSIYPVSLAEACAWYARCQQWANDTSGTVALLCKMAADALPE